MSQNSLDPEKTLRLQVRCLGLWCRASAGTLQREEDWECVELVCILVVSTPKV